MSEESFKINVEEDTYWKEIKKEKDYR